MVCFYLYKYTPFFSAILLTGLVFALPIHHNPSVRLQTADQAHPSHEALEGSESSEIEYQPHPQPPVY